MYARPALALCVAVFVFVLCNPGAVVAQGLKALSPVSGASSPSGSQALSSVTSAQRGPGVNQDFGQVDFLPVEVAYPLAVEPDGDNALRLIWQMPAGYYLYKHAFRFSVTREEQALESAASFPEALVREDEYFGRVEVYYDSAEVTLASPARLTNATLNVTSQGCADAGLCYPPRTQIFTLDDRGVATEVTPTRAHELRQSKSGVAPGVAATLDLAQLGPMVLLAFLGGLILNLMPCVLPILSLKVLSFACATPRERHRHGIFYSAGVIGGFLAVALALIALRGAGQAVGWGFQLQSPGFVIALAYVFVVLGLALSGVVELGNRFMNLGGDLAASGGAQGSFFTGLLAVVVASPCTAPFMGTALGYALVQPPATGLLVFAALGAGMAAPMLLLSYSELARRFMPRPGPWMERLKQALAFPLYATALWLFWVAGRQTNIDVMAVTLLGALLLSLALWLWRGAMLARGTAIACLAAALVLGSWRPAEINSDRESVSEQIAGNIAFSTQGLQRLRTADEPVFVDVTADWCITCLANKRTVLATAAIQQAFRDAGVTYMVADWTDYDADIADFVASHGRSGIPLYVFYGAGGSIEVLPQLLRKQTVLSVLEKSSQNTLTTARLD